MTLQCYIPDNHYTPIILSLLSGHFPRSLPSKLLYPPYLINIYILIFTDNLKIHEVPIYIISRIPHWLKFLKTKHLKRWVLNQKVGYM